MRKHKTQAKKQNIYNEYRKTLEKPDLTKNEIDVMRYNLKLVATTICEHVWKKKLH